MQWLCSSSIKLPTTGVLMDNVKELEYYVNTLD